MSHGDRVRRGNRGGRALTALVALLPLSVACSSGDGSDSMAITVAAASDLRPAFEQLATEFEDQTGISVTFSFAASGTLREQILNGAPFDLYASANEAYVDEIIAAGHGRPETRAIYAIGRLAVVAAPGFERPRRFEDLADPRIRRIVIANPDHAPYGVAAAEALASLGPAETYAPRLIYGASAADALRIVQSGNADVGIVARALATAADLDALLVPEELHTPLRQALVVTAEGAVGDAAQRFAAHITGPSGQQVLTAAGFRVPDQTDPKPTSGDDATVRGTESP